MMPRTLGIFVCFMLFTLAAQAQIATNKGAEFASNTSTLPLRNVQIEVRQVQRDDTQRAGVQGNVRVELGGGNPSGQLQVEQRHTRQTSNASQYVVVLNGRGTRVNLGSSTPLRVVQTYTRNGALFVSQGTIMLQANTGFVATPRWEGGERIELEIAAQQASRPDADSGIYRSGTIQTNATSSTLTLPLGEWVTIAQSEQDSAASTVGLGGTSSQVGQSGSDVQVRLSLR